MSSGGLPLVSVVVPVYNGERYLAEAIQSVLDQAYSALELIVIDDGSSDGSQHVATRFAPAVRYVRRAHAGAAAARNAGVDLASGVYVAFLDADDLFVRGKLDAQVRALEDAPELDMVFGQVGEFRDGIARTRGVAVPAKLPGSLLIRRASLLRTGAFRSEWRVGEFVEWYLRATEAGLKSAMLPQLVLERRLHDTNLGLRERASRADYARILKESLDRRRASGGG